MDCIYIIGHPEYEKDRIQYVTNKLIGLGFDVGKIKISCPTWSNNITNDLCWKVYDPYLKRGFPCINFKCRWLLKGEISLVLNFYNAISDAVSSGYQRIMVLESDVRFRDDFDVRLRQVMEKAAGLNWSYISLSDGVGTHSDGTNSWYMTQDLKKPRDAQNFAPFRCTDSMIFNRGFIEFLGARLIPFRDCLDWELNSRILEYGGQAYWAEPHLIEQATQKRMSASSLKA
jgi:hypothetical protein